MSSAYRSSSRALIRLPPAMHAELASELEPGERVVWTAAASMRRLRARAIAGFGFPIVWNAFVVMLIVLASQHDAAIWFGAVPLLAMGIPLFGPPLAAWRASRTTFYALTDRRLLVFDHDELVAVRREQIREVVAAAAADDGTGDLEVTAERPRAWHGVLAGVPDARAVAAMIRA